MCYNVQYLTRKRLKYAKRIGDWEEVEEILKELEKIELFPRYHSSGFDHDSLFVKSNKGVKTGNFEFMRWGLIPKKVTSESYANEIQNKTINARGETIFDKKSFKEPAKNQRCIVIVDAFYENHHYHGKTYPFRIFHNDDEPMLIGGLWDVWVNKETGEEVKTVSIVTTKANKIMTKIHNNPKVPEPRMPVILEPEDVKKWLHGTRQEIEKLIKPYPDDKLDYYTVRRLKGNEYIGNVPEITEKFEYPELRFGVEEPKQLGLFD